MKIIGFHGRLGVGKNYIAEHIVPQILRNTGVLPHYHIFYMAFADQVKLEWLRQHPTCDPLDVVIQKPRAIRQAIQEYATAERLRDPTTWIHALWCRIRLLSQTYHSMFQRENKEPLFIITDVRFQNELNWIRHQDGIVFSVVAPQRNWNRIQESGLDPSQYTHESETGIPPTMFDLSDLIFNDVDDTQWADTDNDAHRERLETRLLTYLSRERKN